MRSRPPLCIVLTAARVVVLPLIPMGSDTAAYVNECKVLMKPRVTVLHDPAGAGGSPSKRLKTA